MTNHDKNAPCPCGSTKKYKHCCQRKETIKANPKMAMIPAWLLMGMQHLRADRLQQAKMLYEQILNLNPLQAEAMLWLGVIFHKSKNSDRGIALIQQAISLNPENAIFHSTLGNVFKDLNQNEAAIEKYQKAISIDKNYAEARNNLGI